MVNLKKQATLPDASRMVLLSVRAREGKFSYLDMAKDLEARIADPPLNVTIFKLKDVGELKAFDHKHFTPQASTRTTIGTVAWKGASSASSLLVS